MAQKTLSERVKKLELKMKEAEKWIGLANKKMWELDQRNVRFDQTAFQLGQKWEIERGRLDTAADTREQRSRYVLANAITEVTMLIGRLQAMIPTQDEEE